ncbi:MAG: hypothetical protein HYY44_03590 [Deltaproteobacteria bacterium]|nr:hypothetical protein [Deltaproteobacteria bacterium]MBI4373818.1 hypothetical protein [Deltaproteobacteria bacterium]
MRKNCARQFAFQWFSPAAQRHLRKFYAGFNPAVNQELDCEGVEVTEAQVEAAREGLEFLLPIELGGK